MFTVHNSKNICIYSKNKSHLVSSTVESMYTNVSKYKYIFRQCLLIVAIIVECFIAEAGLSFSGTLLPQLKKNDSTIPITDEQGTWIASVVMLGCFPGPIFGTSLNEFIGRKWTCAGVALLNAASWTIISLSSEVWQLLLGRTLQGIAIGTGYPVLYCFISEVALDKFRSTTLNSLNIGITTGILFSDLMGTYYTWRATARVLTALSLLNFGIFIYLQNTYVWYLNRNREEEAKFAFYWYQGSDQKAIDEFKTLNTITKGVTFEEIRKECMKREFLFPLFIVAWFDTTLVCTGDPALIIYSIDIIKNIVSIDANLAAIIIDILRIFSGIMTGILLVFCPIRRLTNVSCVICTLTIFTTCCSLYWKDNWDGFSWLALASIILFNFVFNLGFVNVSAISVGDLFTGITKLTGVSLSKMYYYALSFLSAQLVPVMFLKLGTIWGLAIFGVANLLGGIGLYFMSPETVHLSNDEITEYFQGAHIFKLPTYLRASLSLIHS